MIEIDRPIFIVGPHRSGTTLLYRILSHHPEEAHLNRGNHRFPRWPRLAHLLTKLGSTDEPREAQRFWDFFWNGGDDHMGTPEAPPHVVKWFRRRVAKILSLRGATRLVSKYPRLSLRLKWLDRVFPGCIFIHMVRDWRGVVSSTVARKVKRSKREGGWFGVRIPGFREMGDLSPELSSGRVFAYVTHELERRRPDYRDRTVTLSYTDLCSSPIETIRRLCDEVGLSWSPEFEATIPTDLRSADYKWRDTLDPATIEEIRTEDPDLFSRYEF